MYSPTSLLSTFSCCEWCAEHIVTVLFVNQESSTVAAGSAYADCGHSSSAKSSPASTTQGSTMSYPGTSVHSNSSAWFWHPSQEMKLPSPSSLPAGCTLELSTSGSFRCEHCRLPGRCLQECVGAKEYENCPDGGAYVRSSDLDDVSDVLCFARTPSPAAELLSLDDLFSRKFTVDSRHEGRMLLVQPRSTVDVDSESDDMTLAREARSEHEAGGATASTLSLNDFLDGDTGSSDPSTPEGCGDNLSISDYEQLVIEGGPTALVDDSSMLPPPPLSLLRNGYSPSTQAKYVFIPAEDGGQHVDSSTDSSDYTNLADDESMASDSQNPVKSYASSNGHNVSRVSGKPLNGMDHVTSSQQLDIDSGKNSTCPTNNHMLVNGLSSVHRPNVLLTRRRKRASLAASAIVRSIQQNGDCRFTSLPSDVRPLLKSNGCGPRTVVLYKDCLDGNGSASSDDCPSLESLDQHGFRSSDGGDTVVCEKPFSSQDDGYCTAKSNVAVQLACCQRLSKITSSSEVGSSADGVFLQDLSDGEDTSSVSAQPQHCMNRQNEMPDFFSCLPSTSRVQSENFCGHFSVSQSGLPSLVNSSDPEMDVEDVGSRHQSSQSFLRHSNLHLSSVAARTCSMPLELVENRTVGPAADSINRHSVGCEVDGDVQQAIDMFAFLDNQASPANAASDTSR